MKKYKRCTTKEINKIHNYIFTIDFIIEADRKDWY